MEFNKSDVQASAFSYLKLLIVSGLLGLAGCSSYPAWLPSSGPSKTQIDEIHNHTEVQGIQIVDISDAIARKQLNLRKVPLLSEVIGDTPYPSYRIGDGDVIEVQIWEAPPASLFSSTLLDSRASSASTVTRFPEQMVNNEGKITMPFIGQLNVRGLALHQVEELIAKKLQQLANQPQVLVRLIQNNTANVTVVGEVASSMRLPLTARGERLLDALAAAGGVRQPVNKMTIQITRGDKVAALPLETIIKDPQQNIMLRAGDVVTSLYQSLSFTVLGAVGKNEEINYESKGISLAQALARAGGLQDHRADAQGVFIFRFESPQIFDGQAEKGVTTPDGKIPVVYRVNLKDPSTFFVAQNFPIEDKDLMYISNASAAELQKFLNIVTGSILYPYVSIKNVTK